MTYEELFKLEVDEIDQLIAEMTPEERTAILESIENDDALPPTVEDLSVMAPDELIQCAMDNLKSMNIIVSLAHARMDAK